MSQTQNFPKADHNNVLGDNGGIREDNSFDVLPMNDAEGNAPEDDWQILWKELISSQALPEINKLIKLLDLTLLASDWSSIVLLILSISQSSLIKFVKNFYNLLWFVYF